MLALGHMKTYVRPVTSHLRHAMTRLTSQFTSHYDAFDVTSKSIRSESTLSETNSSQVVSICCSQSGYRGQV